MAPVRAGLSRRNGPSASTQAPVERLLPQRHRPRRGLVRQPGPTPLKLGIATHDACGLPLNPPDAGVSHVLSPHIRLQVRPDRGNPRLGDARCSPVPNAVTVALCTFVGCETSWESILGAVASLGVVTVGFTARALLSGGQPRPSRSVASWATVGRTLPNGASQRGALVKRNQAKLPARYPSCLDSGPATLVGIMANPDHKHSARLLPITRH